MNEIKDIELYEYLKNHLKKISNLYNIDDLEKYYCLTDYKLKEINTLEGINQAFAQFALHAQNATMISGVINFPKNYILLKEKLCDFNPKSFLKKYSHQSKLDRDDFVANFIKAIKYSDTNSIGLKWKTEKSKNPNALIKRYANSLLDGAIYLSKFTTKKELIKDLNCHYLNGDYETLIKYFKTNIKTGFSEALTCDFLKELDSSFDLPKPDIHIQNTLEVIFNKEVDFYKNKPYKCIKDFYLLLENFRKIDSTYTAYKLDRQIWLCCTGNFFLDKKDNLKKCFLKEIKNL